MGQFGASPTIKIHALVGMFIKMKKAELYNCRRGIQLCQIAYVFCKRPPTILLHSFLHLLLLPLMKFRDN